MRAELAASNTFRAIAEEWYLKNEREGLSSLTLAKIRWLLDKAYVTLANRPITEIGAQEVLMVLRRIEAAKLEWSDDPSGCTAPVRQLR